ncbi:hypothetical protein H0H92_006962 [Tricholoma furcatifolium]|nr:hypothetical protein H0H92_006962 [Tricholoma furcatifolium]
MHAVRPPLPPRRQAPQPPTNEEENESIPKGIRARIASLQLDQVGDASLVNRSPSLPTRPKNLVVQVTTQSLSAKGQKSRIQWTRLSPENLARALARPPPPPPIRISSISLNNVPPDPPPTPPDSGPAQRRVPPLPAPRPEPEPDEPQDEVHDEPGLELGSCLECRDFAHVDTHAALFPRHSVTSLDNLAYDLTEPFPYEVEKARAIFTWLHHNIAYDAESFFSGNIQASTAESTLSSGLAVCDGYAGLFKSLAERVGIQVHKVTGHGKGIGFIALNPSQPVPQYSSNHAWNCAFLDGQWHLIDSCWGSGALVGSVYQQQFTPKWFTSSPREFGRTHFPQDLSYQLIPTDDGGPLSWVDYIMEPASPTIFGDFYKLYLWPEALQPSTAAIQGGTRVLFCVFKRCEHMSTAESDNFVYILSIGNEQIPLELNNGGGWSADAYIPRGIGEASLMYVSTVNGQDAKGIGIKALKNALGRTAMSFGGLAKWTIV